jgi:ankyrin repeat protein
LTINSRAIEGNDLDRVKELVENNCDVNLKDKNDRTPLNLAIKRHYFDIAEYLIDSYANVNGQGNSRLFFWLTDLDPVDGYGPLHYCFLDRKCKVLLTKLLGVKELEVDLRNRLGNTPLVLAICEKDGEGIDLLLHRSANPNARNNEGTFQVCHSYIKREISSPPCVRDE